MTKELIIRKADLSDAQAIQECAKAAYRHYIDRIGKLPRPMLEDYAKTINQHTVFIAISNTVVGVLVLIKNDTGMLLDNIAVHPHCQGKGLGRKLLELAESEAMLQGFKALTLYTNEAMTENITIYKNRGYIEIERKKEQGYNRIYMQKLLT